MERHICPPDVYDTTVVSVQRVKGGYSLSSTHRHVGLSWGLCETENYELQTWTETVDVVLAVLDTCRPGACAAGWEQLELFSS